MDLIYPDEIIEFGNKGWDKQIGEFASLFKYLGKTVIKINKYKCIKKGSDGNFCFETEEKFKDFFYIVSLNKECYIASDRGSNNVYICDWGCKTNLRIIGFEKYNLLIFTKR